jgi:hypothetical protein
MRTPSTVEWMEERGFKMSILQCIDDRKIISVSSVAQCHITIRSLSSNFHNDIGQAHIFNERVLAQCYHTRFSVSWPIFVDNLPARFEKSVPAYPGVPASPFEQALPTTMYEQTQMPQESGQTDEVKSIQPFFDLQSIPSHCEGIRWIQTKEQEHLD